MTNVIAELSQWASTLPYWEQATLDKIVAGVLFTESDYDELVRYLLEDADLAVPTGARPALCLPQVAGAAAQTVKPVKLVMISNLQNVNALVAGQTLTFDAPLTMVFGANGSGKSGYARVLACAGFTRGDREVLPDVTQPASTDTVLSADIEISDGVSSRLIPYQIGCSCPELATFYVFDSTSVRTHLTGSNLFSFSPAGLSFLPRMAEETDKVRDRLRARIEECMHPHNFGLLFQGDSPVSQLITNLGPTTDLTALRDMAEMTAEDQARLCQLDIEIAALKVQNIPHQIAFLTQTIDDLRLLVASLRQAREALGDKTLQEFIVALSNLRHHQEAARSISADQFRSPYHRQTGTSVWHRFVEAARALAEAEQSPDRPYPQADSRCLLCQQPLSPEARDLLLRLWAFLAGEAQIRLDAAQADLQRKRETLTAIDLDFFDHQFVSYRYLQQHHAMLLETVASFVEACRSRRESLNSLLNGSSETPIPRIPDADGILDIGEAIRGLETQRNELEDTKPAERIEELQKQLWRLQHRVLLTQHLPQIESYVRKRIWADRAGRITGTTKHITKKHNDLFAKLVTSRYVEVFTQLLNDFQRPLKVKVDTKGRKGEVYKQIVIAADPSIPTDKAKPDKVLSEGEKRAVALADFLTEVALDTTSSGIILDDPVTSLDLEWRQLIASVLVKEAGRRQVIVFTHDLPFLYFLKEAAHDAHVGIASHWIKRGDSDGRPGYVYLNNSPTLEQDYKSAQRAREFYARAKDAAPAEQEALLQQGFGALRTTYEAFIVFELFNGVVRRFDERLSFGRLTDIVWDAEIAQEVNDKCEFLSRHIEGHSHSNSFVAQKPTPDMLLQEIDAFESLRKRLRDLKTKHKPQ